MRKGFHLLDGLLACFILLVSVQGSWVLIRKCSQTESLVQEKRMSWEILKRIRQCPGSFLDKNEALEFSYQGEEVEEDGFFQVRIGRFENETYVEYHIVLTYKNFLGESVSQSMVRRELNHG